MATGPDLDDYIDQRAAGYRNMDEHDIRAYRDAVSYVERTVDVSVKARDSAVAENNQFERDLASSYGLAISFMIAGLLSSPLTENQSLAARILFLLTIIFAGISNLLMLADLLSTNRFFKKVINNKEEIAEYASAGEWSSPNEFRDWVSTKQFEQPTSSTGLFRNIAGMALLIAMGLLIAWLAVRIF